MEPAKICTTDTAANQLLGARLGICNLQVLIATITAIGGTVVHGVVQHGRRLHDIGVLQVLSEDLDLDGKQDRIRVELGIVNMERVTSVALLLEFEYKLKVCLRALLFAHRTGTKDALGTISCLPNAGNCRCASDWPSTC